MTLYKVSEAGITWSGFWSGFPWKDTKAKSKTVWVRNGVDVLGREAATARKIYSFSLFSFFLFSLNLASAAVSQGRYVGN